MGIEPAKSRGRRELLGASLGSLDEGPIGAGGLCGAPESFLERLRCRPGNKSEHLAGEAGEFRVARCQRGERFAEARLKRLDIMMGCAALDPDLVSAIVHLPGV